MEKISQLVDGELGRWESRAQIKRLQSDEALAQTWETYHLIGDALRREAELSPDFGNRLHRRLGSEPTILAPHMRLSHRAVRYTLPVAAGIAGVTLVAWLGLSFQSAVQPGPGSGPGMVASREPEIARPAPSPAKRGAAVNDYLTAHQEFSPSTTMQGLASYVRAVSTDESNAR
jgi:sigma-E factor negative regulatory protein RseA